MVYVVLYCTKFATALHWYWCLTFSLERAFESKFLSFERLIRDLSKIHLDSQSWKGYCLDLTNWSILQENLSPGKSSFSVLVHFG